MVWWPASDDLLSERSAYGTRHFLQSANVQGPGDGSIGRLSRKATGANSTTRCGQRRREALLATRRDVLPVHVAAAHKRRRRGLNRRMRCTESVFARLIRGGPLKKSIKQSADNTPAIVLAWRLCGDSARRAWRSKWFGALR